MKHRIIILIGVILISHIQAYAKKRPVDNGFELPAYNSVQQPFFYSAYTVLFDRKANIPRWVAWTYSFNKRPKISSHRPWGPDPNLGADSPTYNTYTNSGYSRGHMCPVNECLWNQNALKESCYMSNICPQTDMLNEAKGLKGFGSPWRIVEEKCEGPWIKKYRKLYIVAGPLHEKVIDLIPFKDGRYIEVPKRFFKAIVGVTSNNEFHGIGFIFTQDCSKFEMVSIDRVEIEAKLDLFFNIPSKIQKKVEAETNFSRNNWPDIEILYKYVKK